MRQAEYFFGASILLASIVSWAQNPSKPSDIDPVAVAALEKMGAYLRTLRAFEVEAQINREEVLNDDEKVTVAGTATTLVATPDRLRAEIFSDQQHRTYFYDGKSFTLWAASLNYYATVPAPATIVALVDRLEDRYGIELPLADLVRWGVHPAPAAAIRSAIDAGPAQVEGTTCEHYVFRQDGLDWQIWIQLGDFPLPRRLILTTTTDKARPQYTSTMTWNLAPSFNQETFVFAAPAAARQIVIEELKPAATEPAQ